MNALTLRSTVTSNFLWRTQSNKPADTIITQCCYVIRSTRLPKGSQWLLGWLQVRLIFILKMKRVVSSQCPLSRDAVPVTFYFTSLNNTLILGIWCSTIPHLPGCFCPWTFFQNIGFNMVPLDPFMSHLATQLGYSAGEFQALQLIVLAAFGGVD